jgi:Subtilase family/Divergent InlB B-repeat domain
MRARFAGATLLLAVLSAALLPTLAVAQSAPSGTASSLIVKVVGGLTIDQQNNIVARNGGTLTSSIPALRLLVVTVLVQDVDATLARYQADPQVQSVEQNKVRVSESVPSDAFYANQWALPKIGWDQVFGVITPTGSAKVALLDTGVDASHPELADRVVAGTSILDGSNGMTDPSGHGTWLAGIIAAQTDNGAEGIAGVAYAGVQIVPVTVLNANGEGQDSDVIAGVIWAADHGADVILMAFSAPDFSQNLQDAIDYAWSKGAMVVAAVGNNAVNAPTFPAGDRGVMGVAATDQNDTLAPFSNDGQAVFIAAPGVDIQTIDINGQYIVISGTSTSAAYVAGLAAFMKAVDPTLTNGIIVGRIARNADPAGTQDQTGNGRINMPRALADTSTEFIEPAGAAPVGNGGPFVGPYRAAAANVSMSCAPNPIAVNSQTTCTATTGGGSSANATISWSASGSGSFSPTTCTTGSKQNGSCSVGYTPSAVGSGSQNITATDTTDGVTSNSFLLTVYGPAAKLAFTTSPSNSTAGTAFGTQPVVTLQDVNGTTVTGTAQTVTLAIQNNPGGGTLSGTTAVAVNTATGRATFIGLSIDKAGTGYTLTATGSTVSTTPGVVLSSAFNITAGAVNTVSFVQQPTDTAAGANITPAVTVRAQDSLGNNVSGATVTMTLQSGAGPLNGTTSRTTDANGIATFNDLSINVIGSKTLRATSNAKTADSAAFNIVPAGASKVVFVQQPTTTTAGQAIAPAVTVQLQDSFSNNVSSAGVLINIALTGTGTLSGTTTQLTGANGLATFSDLSINLSGSKNLTASSTGLPSAVSSAFTINAAAASTLSFSTQPPATVTAGALFTAAVKAQDQFGNNVPSLSITVALTSGSGTLSGTLTQPTPTGVGTTGIATFNNFNINLTGTKKLTASAGGLSVDSNIFTVNAAAVNTVAFVQQPTDTAAGQTIAPAVTVQAKDSFGNNVPNASVVMSISAGTGALSGTLTQSTDASGIATFGNLSINLAGSKTLRATSNARTTDSVAFNITAGTASKLGFGQQPPTTTFGQTINPPVTIQVQDSLGNVITTDNGRSVAIAIGSNPGGGTLSGTTSATTVNGIATFSNLSIDKVGTGYTLTASSPGLTGVTSSTFNINNPTPTISSISPDHACTGQTLNVIVTGTGFASGVTTVSVNMSQNISIVTAVNSPTQLTATFTIGSNATTGSRNFMATNAGPGGGTANVNSGFTIGTTNCPPSTSIISASAGSGGSITPSGSVTVNSGANQAFTITPDTGYHVADVLVDGSSVSAVTTYTFTNVTANHSIAASFALNTYSITASAGANGSISPSGTATVSHGANQSFTITPAAGYHVADVLVDGSSVGAVTTYTFTNVTANHTIAASFNINTYTIAAAAGANGSISPSGNVTVNYGADQSFTITPDTGYHIADVLVDGSSVGAVSSYTFLNVTANHSIAASFAINTYSITASTGVNGSITPSGSVSVTYGANQTFTITPDTGYQVADLLVDGSSVGAVTAYTFINVTSNHTIAASFVDATPPDTTVDSGPTSPTNATIATLTFSGTDNVTAPANLTFECKLDSSGFGACISPVTYNSLADGPHTFYVRARDAAGNVDPTPAQFSWSVDTAPPDTLLDSMPFNPTNQTTANFTFHATEPSSTFECSLDGGAFAPCSSPAQYTVVDGSHTFQVRAIDQAHNPDPTPASFTWTVDTLAPDTMIDSMPADPTNSNTATFTFHGDLTGGDTFQCQLDAQAPTACNGGTATYTGLGEGLHTFTVAATDAAGNTDQSAASFAWTIDVTSPDTTITGGPSDGSSTTNTSASFDFEGTDNFTAAGSLTFECSLDGGAFATCTSPIFYSGLSRTSHTFQVRAKDQAGNVDPTPATTTWTITKINPVITWENPADITYPTLLSATQLNATADVAGSFVYTPVAGTKLNAGAGQLLKVDFTPTDTANYNPASKTVSINVLKGTPVITWANPPDILYGTALSAAQLNATANIPGTFTYAPAAGTVLNPGSGQVLKVDFTPTDAPNYNTATKTVYINVVYTFIGLLQPVDNPPVVNTGSPGRTYPVKWQLKDANGNYVSDLSSVTSLQYTIVLCGNLDTALSSPLDTTATGGTVLRYDATANQFIYNWQTPNTSNVCYVLMLTLKDGTTHTASFQMKK